MGKVNDYVSLPRLLPRCSWKPYGSQTLKRKSEILRKAHELEDGYRYLRSNGKAPITADEYRLKAEALRWVLGDKETL